MRSKVLPMLFGVEIGIGAVIMSYGIYTGAWQIVALGGSVSLVHGFEWLLLATNKQ